jgi:uridine kinase
MSRDEALSYFGSRKRSYTVEWIKSTNKNAISVNTCCGYSDLSIRCLLASTGQASNVFDLIRVPDYNGMVILFSSPHDHTQVSAYRESKVLCDVYREWNKLGQIQNVGCAGELNNTILTGNARKFISLSESLQTKKMAELATMIHGKIDTVKLILIAGPSSSGKTTFAAKLSLQLEIFGFQPLVLSVDNYYKAHADCPRDEKGNLDFEVIDALRIDRLNDDLVTLLGGKTTATPIFDFHVGAPKEETNTMKLPKRGVIIMEGIHCLNEKLTPLVNKANKFHIFIAPLSQLNIDETNFLSNSVNRLARRIVRDYRTRGYSALDTITRWPSVLHAEEHFIFPFINVADAVFNTALDYELTVLKDHTIPLLLSVKPDMPMYTMATELLEMLSFFHSAQDHTVPPDSLLREFIGGSFFGAI